VIKKGLGREQTIELVRSKMQGPKTRVRGDSVQVKFGNHKGAIKVVASRGEFTMNFRGLSEDEIEDLKRRVESVLAGQLTM
jgi:metal-dependent amidase/aminoacylase/carboxypeptidase family protein